MFSTISLAIISGEGRLSESSRLLSLSHTISRLNLSPLNGLELLKKVKTSNPKVRTISMSAYNFEEEELYQQYMREAVINSTIEKPVTMNRLYQRVRDRLDVN